MVIVQEWFCKFQLNYITHLSEESHLCTCAHTCVYVCECGCMCVVCIYISVCCDAIW